MTAKKIILGIGIVLFFLGCATKKTSGDGGTQLIDSLKRSTVKKSLGAIDSILLIGHVEAALRARLYFEKGKLFSKEENYKEAVSVLDQALVLFEQQKEKAYLLRTYWKLGEFNVYLSNLEVATEQLLKALDYSKELNNKKLEASIYSSLAHLHFKYDDLPKSIAYVKKAIQIQKEEKDTLGLSATYNNLAVIYKNNGDYSKALEYNNSSLELNKKYKDSSAIAKSYNNLGALYQQLKKDSVAISYFRKALGINDRNGQLNSTSARNLADCYERKKNFPVAKSYLEYALFIEHKTMNISLLKDIYSKLLHIALAEQDLKNSLHYQEERDKLVVLKARIENKEKLEMLANQYELASSQKALQQEKRINNKNRIIFIVFLGLAFLLGLFLFQRFRNRQLKDEKEKLQLEQKVLRSQMNPHFIFNALSAIQNSLMDNDPIQSASYLSRFAKLIRQNFEFVNEKTIPLADELDALKNYMDTQKMRFKDRFEYKFNVSEKIDLESVEIPPLLLQPFVENAIEHGFKNLDRKGLVELKIFEKNNRICFEIKDNGNGFDTIQEDGKLHSREVFRQRLKLLGNKEEESFFINSSKEGTLVEFSLLV